MRRRRAGRDRGQATVEVALALPVVVLALLLVLQVALVARAQILVVQAAREGARRAAVDPAAAPAVAAARATPGLRPDRMTVTVGPRGAPGGTVTVTVRYRAPTDVPLVGALIGDPMVRAEVTMRVEDPPADEPVP